VESSGKGAARAPGSLSSHPCLERVGESECAPRRVLCRGVVGGTSRSSTSDVSQLNPGLNPGCSGSCAGAGTCDLLPGGVGGGLLDAAFDAASPPCSFTHACRCILDKPGGGIAAPGEPAASAVAGAAGGVMSRRISASALSTESISISPTRMVGGGNRSVAEARRVGVRGDEASSASGEHATGTAARRARAAALSLARSRTMSTSGIDATAGALSKNSRDFSASIMMHALCLRHESRSPSSGQRAPELCRSSARSEVLRADLGQREVGRYRGRPKNGTQALPHSTQHARFY
jgi:hypothetical protein